MTRGLLDPLAELESLSSWAQPSGSMEVASNGAEGVLAAARRRLGRTIARKWQLQALIGLGGMAAVYEARHRTGRRVALKVMHAHLLDDRRLQKRFIREAYVVNAIEHPAIVPVHDADIDETGAPFLVMDLLEGQTVEALRVEHGGKLPAPRVLEIAERVLDALAVAHGRGIVHRDIKPANLFSTALGELKVLDFGIASSRERSAGLGTQTRSGSLLGTPAFVAPEQARGRSEEVNQQSDLWSLGATLFTLLSGETVHQAENANELWGQAMSASARSLRSVAPDAPPALIDAVDGALRYDKKERWVSAQAMRAALLGGGTRSKWDAARARATQASTPCAASTLSATQTSVPEHAVPARPSRPRWRPLLAPLALAPIGLVAIWMLRSSRPGPDAPELSADVTGLPRATVTAAASTSPTPNVARFSPAVNPAQPNASAGTNTAQPEAVAETPVAASGPLSRAQGESGTAQRELSTRQTGGGPSHPLDAVAAESGAAALQAADAVSAVQAASDTAAPSEASNADLLDLWN